MKTKERNSIYDMMPIVGTYESLSVAECIKNKVGKTEEGIENDLHVEFTDEEKREIGRLLRECSAEGKLTADQLGIYRAFAM